MKLFWSRAIGWVAASLVVPTPPSAVQIAARRLPSTLSGATTATTARSVASVPSPASPLREGVTTWLAAAAAPPPSPEDIALLRAAFAEVYGAQQRGSNGSTGGDWVKAEALLSEAVQRWQSQPADERAGLYRVRGDCYMALGDAAKAVADYDAAVTLLQSPPGAIAAADPAELPAAWLGRARAAKSLAAAAGRGGTAAAAKTWAAAAARDYEAALTMSRGDGDGNDDDSSVGGTARNNPYAAWEWGDALRLAGDYSGAAAAHARASAGFAEIGDRARSVIAQLDAGLDLAADAAASGSGSDSAAAVRTAVDALGAAIDRTAGVEGRDVPLLQRVIVKEGEARMALAALLWSDGPEQRGRAEAVRGDACLRLDQLQAQRDATAATAAAAATKPRRPPGGGAIDASATTAAPNVQSRKERLLYSIDDDERGVGLQLSCRNFKNPQFLTDTLAWPESLQQKVIQLETLR